MTCRHDLPPELASLVVASVPTRSLRSVALISRAWVRPAQRQLFRFLSINPDYLCCLKQHPHLDFLSARPHISCHVEYINISTFSSEPADRVCLPDDAANSALFECLPWLAKVLPRVDDLHFLGLGSRDIFIYFIAHLSQVWPEIKNINMSFYIALHDPPAWPLQSVTFPSIRSLSLSIDDVRILVLLLSALGRTSVQHSLATLHVSSFCSRTNEDPNDLSSYVRAIGAFSNLTEISVWITAETKVIFDDVTSNRGQEPSYSKL
jgi:hypothetical protein